MDDGDKIAAATLAAVAAQQKQELKPSSQRQTQYDITGELLNFYQYFLAAIRKQKP